MLCILYNILYSLIILIDSLLRKYDINSHLLWLHASLLDICCSDIKRKKEVIDELLQYIYLMNYPKKINVNMSKIGCECNTWPVEN